MAGGSMYQDDDQAAISDINVTPLVDVTLVLLIIFMVTAKLIVARGISVDSPKTASGDDVKSTLQVTIDKERKLYVNGEPYTSIEAAKKEVKKKSDANPELKAIITADSSVPHGDVMTVIDFVKLAGVTKFALTSDPLGTETEALPGVAKDSEESKGSTDGKGSGP